MPCMFCFGHTETWRFQWPYIQIHLQIELRISNLFQKVMIARLFVQCLLVT